MSPGGGPADGPTPASAGGAMSDEGRVPAPEPCSQRQQRRRVADGGGQPDALQRAPGEAGEPFQHGQQVPAAVVAGEGVHLVDDDGLQAGEELGVVDVDADQHRLQRLGRGQQDVGPLAQDRASGTGADVAVPQRRLPADPAGVGLEPRQQVVQQRLQRAQVQHRGALPLARRHPGQQRETSRPRSCRPRSGPAAGRHPRPSAERWPRAAGAAGRASPAC